MPQEIQDAIKQDAQDPKEVTSDGTTVKQHDLSDQIEADRYLASQVASKKKVGLGIRRTRMVPPGSI